MSYLAISGQRMNVCEPAVGEQLCPVSLQRYCPPGSTTLQISKFVALPALFSCTLSCIGSILIVYTYCRWKDIRTGSRKIITYLSIADFFTAFGYIIGSTNYFVHFDKEECGSFVTLCQIQSFIMTCSSLSSFFWTATLAVYLYASMVHNVSDQAQRFFPILHVIGWGFPLVICFPLLATGYLGYSNYAVSTWCYVKLDSHDGPSPKIISLIFIAGKFWEILAYIIVFVFYFLIKIFLKNQAKKINNPGVVAMLRRSDMKLILIPVLFVLLRYWGTIHFFFALSIKHFTICGCTSHALFAVFTVLGILQAIGDGGQGWGNVILYIMASEKIRKKLLSCQGCHQEQNKPILPQHDLNRCSSDIKNYGGNLNGNPNDEISIVPTTV